MEKKVTKTITVKTEWYLTTEEIEKILIDHFEKSGEGHVTVDWDITSYLNGVRLQKIQEKVE